jgi:hypothetical protein
MDRIELRIKMESETGKASDNENGTKTDVSQEYVEWLEQQVKNCSIPNVSQQRELLRFLEWHYEDVDCDQEQRETIVDQYLKQ